MLEPELLREAIGGAIGAAIYFASWVVPSGYRGLPDWLVGLVGYLGSLAFSLCTALAAGTLAAVTLGRYDPDISPEWRPLPFVIAAVLGLWSANIALQLLMNAAHKLQGQPVEPIRWAAFVTRKRRRTRRRKAAPRAPR